MRLRVPFNFWTNKSTFKKLYERGASTVCLKRLHFKVPTVVNKYMVNARTSEVRIDDFSTAFEQDRKIMHDIRSFRNIWLSLWREGHSMRPDIPKEPV